MREVGGGGDAPTNALATTDLAHDQTLALSIAPSPLPARLRAQDDAAPGGEGGSGVTLKLDLPYQLKKALVDDWEYITQK